MRTLIVCNIISLDGYFEGPGANVMALPMDGFFDEHNLRAAASRRHAAARRNDLHGAQGVLARGGREPRGVTGGGQQPRRGRPAP
jgi:hypothetical protein